MTFVFKRSLWLPYREAKSRSKKLGGRAASWGKDDGGRAREPRLVRKRSS